MVDAINRNDNFIVAQYLTSEILGLDSHVFRGGIEGKNKGGQIFKDSLIAYFDNRTKFEHAKKIIKYILDDPTPQKILNLQMRPPESGFIFTPKEIKDAGIKICVTCHEYKLNYDRRWLQAILHPYFEAADKVFFFNEKDLSNANKHANPLKLMIDFFILLAAEASNC